MLDEGKGRSQQPKKTRRVVEAPTSEFGPWQPNLLGPTTAKEWASKVLQSRSHGIAAQDPLDQVNKKEYVTIEENTHRFDIIMSD